VSFWSRIERRIEEFAGDIYPDEFRESLTRARAVLQEEDFAEAETQLLALVDERPEHVGALVLLGVARLKQGKAEKALLAFGLALERAKDVPEALIGSGDAELALGRAEAAIPYFRSAVDAAQGDRGLLAEAYRGLGVAYRRAGDLDKAIRELRKAVAEASDDATIVAALGEALTADGGRSNDEAKRYLERLADREGCPSVAWLALGRIAIGDGDLERAIEYYERVLDTEEQSELLHLAHRGIGTAKLQLGELEAAEEVLRSALGLKAQDAATLSLLGQTLEALGQGETAMSFYDRSLNCAEDLGTANMALALALRTGDIAGGVLMANRVLARDAASTNALTARGLELYADGKVEAARATYEQAIAHSETTEALLALSQLELAAKNNEAATKHARRALRLAPKEQRAKDLLAECRAADLGVQLQADSDWYDLASATGRLCARHPELQSLVQESSVALAEYDQPLLVAVMGEFSSGKSSFVNAFIGADVAPMGITPTTATINIVKYGRTRGARVVYRDNTSRELSGEGLSQSLSDIDDHEARRVQHVEILMPIDVLERVNIVDTPGLNSILPEHEAVARGFLQRADAVVWLFTANQAGKTTEKNALDSIGEHGVRVLGVLNKIDQLKPGQVKEIVAYVGTELGERVETCVPISARRALKGEPESGWEQLRSELEERFFKHSRELKKQALNRRLEVVLDHAQERAAGRMVAQSERSAGLREAAQMAQASMIRFVDEVVAQERATISRDLGPTYLDCSTAATRRFSERAASDARWRSKSPPMR
jgi:tetratricopeptide (TPR) repeat protein/GTPase SAR1 family protein